MSSRYPWLPVIACCAAIAAAADPAGESRSQLSQLLSADGDAGFEKAIAAREFAFPADHGPHPGFRNEWWYMTGNLEADSGRRFGFELTIFRFSLSSEVPASASAWRTNQVYIAHFALTDVADERFFVAEKYSRGAAGLAGAQAEPFRVWIDDWQIAMSGREDRWRLQANDDEFAIDLEMDARKPPILNGVDGLSQKSAEPGNASYYYSMPRWQTSGSVRVGAETFQVAGLSWLDREWSSSALGDDQQGWDWFALQLSDGTELMYYQLRKADGTPDVHSGGTWISTAGSARRLQGDEVHLEVTDTWTSPDGGDYPSRWTLGVAGLDLELDIEPVMADQELSTLVRYWEGAVDIAGRRGGLAVSGRGYVELTGYAEDLP